MYIFYVIIVKRVYMYVFDFLISGEEYFFLFKGKYNNEN